MRILFICPYSWEYGGPPKVVFDLSEVFLQSDTNTVAIASVCLKNQKTYTLADKVDLHEFKGSFLSKIWPYFSFKLFFWLLKNAKKYDVIHVHGIWHFPSFVPFVIKSKAKKVLSVHGMLEPWGLQKGAFKKKLFSFLFQKRILKNCDVIHVLKTSEKNDVEQFLGAGSMKSIKVIPNGLKINEFSLNTIQSGVFREKYQLQSSPFVLFLGRINEKKGIRLLLSAFLRISKQNKFVKLVIAGPDDGFLSEMMQFINQNNLNERIIYTGMLSGNLKEAVLSDANVFVLPSYSEGFSIAALEALYAGVPCCFSDNIGFSEVVSKEKAGIIAQMNEVDLSDKLLWMLENENACKAMAKRGVELVKDYYDIEIIGERFLDEYSQI
ncbi:MAG: glycosyltransferase [Pseudarcicella sp.]|nr:glycosyltransferase [Pseudarcicella sp.]